MKLHSKKYIFSLDNTQYNDYIVKRNETKNFLTFFALVTSLAFFIAVAIKIFFTKISRKREIYIWLCVFSLFIGIISLGQNLIVSESWLKNGLNIVSIIFSVLYGATAFYMLRRILMPSLILSSIKIVISLIPTSEYISKPLDFIVRNCALVLFAVLGALIACFVKKIKHSKESLN